jgi:hypothetical protein
MAEWCPFFTRVDCPTQDRQYQPPQSKRGMILHDAVAYWGGSTPNGQNGDRGGSWHATIKITGQGYQHFPLSANTWHGGDIDPDGGVSANYDLIGVEHERESGLPANVLTPPQLETSARFAEWCAAQFGLSGFGRYPNQTGVWTLAEHNQVANPPGTACPSNRIPWEAYFALLNKQPVIEEEDMTQALLARWVGRQYYVVVGQKRSDNHLYARHYGPGGADWGDLSGQAVFEPQITANDERVDVVAFDANQAVVHYWFINGTWGSDNWGGDFR